MMLTLFQTPAPRTCGSRLTKSPGKRGSVSWRPLKPNCGNGKKRSKRRWWISLMCLVCFSCDWWCQFGCFFLILFFCFHVSSVYYYTTCFPAIFFFFFLNYNIGLFDYLFCYKLWHIGMPSNWWWRNSSDWWLEKFRDFFPFNQEPKSWDCHVEFRARQHLLGLGMPLLSVKLETGRKKSDAVNCFPMCIYIYMFI